MAIAGSVNSVCACMMCVYLCVICVLCLIEREKGRKRDSGVTALTRIPSAPQAHLPFAVVGSTEEVKIGNKMVKARQYPWGTVQGKLGHVQREMRGGVLPFLATISLPLIPPQLPKQLHSYRQEGSHHCCLCHLIHVCLFNAT